MKRFGIILFPVLALLALPLLLPGSPAFSMWGRGSMISGHGSSPPPPPPPPGCGTTPAGAVNAGFTTCAANYDFTQTLPGNWLDCGAGDGATHQWYQGEWWYGTPWVSCNVFQTTDGGSQVIDMQWLPSMKTTGTGQTKIDITTMSADTSKVVDFPNNAYYEAEYRVSNDPVNPTHSPISSAWSYNSTVALIHGGVNNSDWEVDDIETCGQVGGCYDANFAARGFIWQGTSNLPGGYTDTVYHKYAVRLTSDGTNIVGCSYLDNVLVGSCVTTSRPGIGLRNFLELWVGQIDGTNDTIPQMDMYVRHYRVWSCASWAATDASGNCNGALSPPP